MGEGGIKAYIDKLTVKLKSDRKLEMQLYGAIAALCLLLCLPTIIGDKGGEKASGGEYTAASEKYNEQEALENRLMETLSCIRGAGQVKVMITYDTGTEMVPAMSTDIAVSSSGINGASGENRTESSQPVTVYRNGEDQAVVIMEKMPQVRGVIVVAEGAGDISVKLKLQSAVQAVLGVEASRVEVLEMGIAEREE